MKTIILNGSPKANIKESNTQIFINEFQKEIKNKYPERPIIREDNEKLVNELKDYDTILFFMPLYVHGMPGSVMRFIEKLEEKDLKGKNIGFVVQAGFPETQQEQYIIPYFEELCEQLHCKYLGTVCKGESAAIYMFPKQYKKVYKILNELGVIFEEINEFDKSAIERLALPYNLSDYSAFKKLAMKVAYKSKLCDLGWNYMLKQRNAFKNRFDKPFVD